MWLKGLHLEDIQQVFVDTAQQAQQQVQQGAASQFAIPGFGTVAGTPTQNYAPVPPPAQGNQTFRLATFNIQVFGDTKASKPHVMWELAAIVNRFDIVAIQEIRTQDDAFMARFAQLCSQVGGRAWQHHVGPRLGNTRSTEQYAYLWDAAKFEINPNMVYTVADPENVLHREPLVAMFRTRGVPPEQAFTFVLVNIHTDPDVAKDEMNMLPQLYNLIRDQTMRLYGQAEDDIIVLGDFNTNVPMTYPPPPSGNRPITQSDFGLLGNVPGLYPVVRDEPTNVIRNRLHDNILIQRQNTSEYTLRGGVYDIERNNGRTLEQVKEISDHLPVWAEFSVYESGIPGQVATGAGMNRR
jgi:endonuclease/exonuclease/phosphatase family metal-dependent hydrolase